MPKRFTDSEKWKDDWFLSLDNDYRIVWFYILDNCTPAGRLKKNFKLMNFCCNTKLEEKNFLEIFKNRVIDKGDFFFIPKFLKFQYPKGLNSDKPAIIGVRNELLNYGLYDLVKETISNDYLIIKDKDKDKDKEKDMDKDKDKDKDFGKRGNLLRPTLDECQNYFYELKALAEAEKFFDYFSANGWKVGGRAPMKDWRAAARNWVRRSTSQEKNVKFDGLSRAQKSTLKKLEEFNERRNIK